MRLTERQKEVLLLAAKGLSNSKIADTLIITEYTVKAHLCAIYEILKADGRVSAVTTAIKLGLIPIDKL